MPDLAQQIVLVTSIPQEAMVTQESLVVQLPVKIPKKRGRKPKPKPLPEDGFKIVFGEFIIDFNQ
jgi:hypothetical protein